MTSPAQDQPVPLDLSPEQAWVVHATLVAEFERAIEDDDDPERKREMLWVLEDGASFDRYQLRTLQCVLRRYLDDAPVRDQSPGEGVLDRIEHALA